MKPLGTLPFLGALLAFQTADAGGIGGRPLELERVVQLGRRLEQGYRALTAPTLGLGRLVYGDCVQTRVAELHCTFNYDKGSEYAYVSRLSADLSYLDGIPGESIHRFQIDTVAKRESN